MSLVTQPESLGVASQAGDLYVPWARSVTCGMSVIAHLRIPADSFELGRVLAMESGANVELETMVPIGEKAVPFFSVEDGAREPFESSVRDHPSVDRLNEVSHHDDTTLYALDWAVTRDVFFQGVLEHGAQVLTGIGGHELWEFELRFPDHESLGEFQEYCVDAHISLEVGRIYNPTRPESGMWYGLTGPQRDTLMRAVREGYYAIPREISTKELAEEFDVSDQAVTERLRRAITTLAENSLLAAEETEQWERVD